MRLSHIIVAFFIMKKMIIYRSTMVLRLYTIYAERTVSAKIYQYGGYGYINRDEIKFAAVIRKRAASKPARASRIKPSATGRSSGSKAA